MGPIYYQRGPWEEKLGLSDKAVDSYRRFLDLLQFADTEFDDRKEFVQQRIDALLDSGAREPTS